VIWRIPAELGQRQRQLLALLAAASFFEGYDLNVGTVALPQIRDTFHLTQSRASAWIALLFLGALPAAALARQADRFGRRRLLLVSITGYTVATAATAISSTMVMFGVAQMVARLFLVLEVSLTWTVITEEFPAHLRGFGYGMLAMLDVLGAGSGALLFGLVLAPLGVSWRGLYVAALPVLIAVALMRRALPETTRYTTAASGQHLARRASELWRPPHRRRILVIVAASITGGLLTQASVFVVDFLQTQRHVSTSTASLLIVAAGAAAIPTLVAAGRASDRYGRKLIGCTFLLLSVAGPLLFFLVARGAPALFASLTLTYVGQFGSWPTLGGFSVELFPTRLRAMSRAVGNTSAVVGQGLSFLLGSALLTLTGGMPMTVVILSAGPLVSLLLVARGLPETAGRSLEELNDENPLIFAATTALLPDTPPEWSPARS